MLTVALFFFNDTASTEIYTLSLHDALPISSPAEAPRQGREPARQRWLRQRVQPIFHRLRRAVQPVHAEAEARRRSEEHTSELQSRQYLVCRLLLEKKERRCTFRSAPAPPLR